MAHNEIRVKKSREDKAVDDLASRLTELGGCKFLFPQNALFEGLQELIHNQLKDAANASHRYGRSTDEFLPQDENEKNIYVERLTQCVWQHFHEQAPTKFQGALAELIQESLGFAYSIYGKRRGFGEEEINEARPDLADLQQNVLRRSILRLKSLPYRKRDDLDGVESNEALSPFERLVSEIFNNFGLWTYDHVRIYELLQQNVRSMMKKEFGYNDPDYSPHLAAREAAEFIWDNIDGAMRAMTRILLDYSMLLAFQSFQQRKPTTLTRKQLRDGQSSASDLKKIAAKWLDPWFDVMTVKLSKRGRTPKDESDKKSESARFKIKVINAMKQVLDQPEKISQQGVSKILGIGNTRKKGDRTLYNRLKTLGLDWETLKAESEKEHKEKRTNKKR